MGIVGDEDTLTLAELEVTREQTVRSSSRLGVQRVSL